MLNSTITIADQASLQPTSTTDDIPLTSKTVFWHIGKDRLRRNRRHRSRRRRSRRRRGSRGIFATFTAAAAAAAEGRSEVHGSTADLLDTT